MVPRSFHTLRARNTIFYFCCYSTEQGSKYRKPKYITGKTKIKRANVLTTEFYQKLSKKYAGCL